MENDKYIFWLSVVLMCVSIGLLIGESFFLASFCKEYMVQCERNYMVVMMHPAGWVSFSFWYRKAGLFRYTYAATGAFISLMMQFYCKNNLKAAFTHTVVIIISLLILLGYLIGMNLAPFIYVPMP